MDKLKYFNKNKTLFGVSYKNNYDFFNTQIVKFDNWASAIEWLNSEEYDFKTRELISKTKAKNINNDYKLGYNI